MVKTIYGAAGVCAIVFGCAISLGLVLRTREPLATGSRYVIFMLATLMSTLWIVALPSIGWLFAPFTVMMWAIASTDWPTTRIRSDNKVLAIVAFLGFLAAAFFMLKFISVLVMVADIYRM